MNFLGVGTFILAILLFSAGIKFFLENRRKDGSWGIIEIILSTSLIFGGVSFLAMAINLFIAD